MEGFPLETYFNIFSFLPSVDLANCALASRKFTKSAQEWMVKDLQYVVVGTARRGNVSDLQALANTLEQRPDLASHIGSINITASDNDVLLPMAQTLKNATNIVMLQIHIEMQNIVDKHLNPFSEPSSMPKLDKLSLVGPARLQAFFIAIVSKATHLQNLQLINTSTGSLSVKRTSLGGLKTLVKVDLQNVHHSIVFDILANSRVSLQSIYLEGCNLDQKLPNLHLPALQDLHVNTNCEDFIVAATEIRCLSIFEEHRPLVYFTNYYSACRNITHLFIIEHLCMDYQRVREELVEVFRHNLLPTLTYIEFGAWDTLEQLLQYLPLSIHQIHLHEPEFQYCPFILASLCQTLAPNHLASLNFHIHVDEDPSHFAAVQFIINANWPPALNCTISSKGMVLWRSKKDPCGIIVKGTWVNVSKPMTKQD